MTKEEILDELDALIVEGNSVLNTHFDNSRGGSYVKRYVEEDVYSSWRTKILTFLKKFLPEDSEQITKIRSVKSSLYSNASSCVHILQDVKEYMIKGYIPIEKAESININSVLETIFSRFHKVARQLRCRHNGRDTLSIEDEYDVQDLLHALLQLYFDDIRAEECTPSYAGKSARVDFLLKNEKTVIEVKKTRKGLADKEIGDQLIIDVDRYKAHPDCERLICFVYDPEGRIGNPNGIMDDLNTQHEGFATVIIQPNF